MKDHKEFNYYYEFLSFSYTADLRSDKKLPLENTTETGWEGSQTPSVRLCVSFFPWMSSFCNCSCWSSLPLNFVDCCIKNHDWLFLFLYIKFIIKEYSFEEYKASYFFNNNDLQSLKIAQQNKRRKWNILL